MKPDIFPMTDFDASVMVGDIRDIDRLEFEIMSGSSNVFKSLMELKLRSRRARAAYYDGKLVAIYGVIQRSLLVPQGNPWLCATDAIDDPDVRRAFLKHTKSEFEWLKGDIGQL